MIFSSWFHYFEHIGYLTWFIDIYIFLTNKNTVSSNNDNYLV